MPKFPWWVWIIILLILIGLLPGLYQSVVTHLHAGVTTVCPTCTGG